MAVVDFDAAVAPARMLARTDRRVRIAGTEKEGSSMTASRSAAAPAQPRFVQHAKRPEWGIGRVIDVYQGLQRVRFADGATREFREDVLERVDASAAPAELLALTDAPPPPPARAPRKPRAAKPAATSPKSR